MDTVNSSDSSSIKHDYELEKQAYRRDTRKRLIIITLSSIALITIITCALIGKFLPAESGKHENRHLDSSPALIRDICNVTLYPDTCNSSISSIRISSNSSKPSPDPLDIFMLSLQVALSELRGLSSLPGRLLEYSNSTSDPLLRGALLDCKTLIQDAADYIGESMSSLNVGHGRIEVLSKSKINDIRTWLSSAMTYQETCLVGLQEATTHMNLAQEMRSAMRNSTEFTSNSLAIASNIMTIFYHFQAPVHRKLLSFDIHPYHDFDAKFPTWVHWTNRRLLQEENLKPDITVAKDGSGDFRTIREAVESIPRMSKSMFIVHVKEGVYVENVEIPKDCWNVMIFGDGMYKTIVSGSLNKVDGTPTFSTATFIAAGRGFIASDMGFKNTAGPEKHQAVALRSSSDQSVFHRCSFDAFQDTLYAHSNRQFYLDCDITGTIDFIFGNSAVVLQNCSIQPRQPGPGQFNTITAQGKTDPNQNTGVSIQRCKITPFDSLTAVTYLGRPWKDYSTTVVMQSYVGELVDSTGWTQWTVGVDPPSTIFYGEYDNTGPGSVVDRRVKWAGVTPNMTHEEALEFTVEPFLNGSQWLSKAGITYESTLDRGK